MVYIFQDTIYEGISSIKLCKQQQQQNLKGDIYLKNALNKQYLKIIETQTFWFYKLVEKTLRAVEIQFEINQVTNIWITCLQTSEFQIWNSFTNFKSYFWKTVVPFA